MLLTFRNVFVTVSNRLNKEERRHLRRVLEMEIIQCKVLSTTTLSQLLDADEYTRHIPVKKAHEWLKYAVDSHRKK